MTETVHGLLSGTPIGTHAIAAIRRSIGIGIAIALYLWALRRYTNRLADPVSAAL